MKWNSMHRSRVQRYCTDQCIPDRPKGRTLHKFSIKMIHFWPSLSVKENLLPFHYLSYHLQNRTLVGQPSFCSSQVLSLVDRSRWQRPSTIMHVRVPHAKNKHFNLCTYTNIRIHILNKTYKGNLLPFHYLSYHLQNRTLVGQPSFCSSQVPSLVDRSRWQ